MLLLYFVFSNILTTDNIKDVFSLKIGDSLIQIIPKNHERPTFVADIDKATKFVLEKADDGHLIKIENSNIVLDYSASKGPFIGYTRHGNQNQIFRIKQNTHGNYSLNMMGRCLTKKDNSLDLTDCDSSLFTQDVRFIDRTKKESTDENDEFYIHLGLTMSLKIQNSFLSIEKSNNSIYLGDKRSNAAVVTFIRDKEDTYNIMTENKLYLSVQSTNDIAFLPKSYNYEQRFKIIRKTANYGKIMSVDSEKCLTRSMKDFLVLEACNGDDVSQIFDFQVIHQMSDRKYKLFLQGRSAVVDYDYYSKQFIVTSSNGYAGKTFRFVQAGVPDLYKIVVLPDRKFLSTSGTRLTLSAHDNTHFRVIDRRNGIIKIEKGGECIEVNQEHGEHFLFMGVCSSTSEDKQLFNKVMSIERNYPLKRKYSKHQHIVEDRSLKTRRICSGRKHSQNDNNSNNLNRAEILSDSLSADIHPTLSQKMKEDIERLNVLIINSPNQREREYAKKLKKKLLELIEIDGYVPLNEEEEMSILQTMNSPEGLNLFDQVVG